MWNVLTSFRTTKCFKSLVWKFLYVIFFSYGIHFSDDNFRVRMSAVSLYFFKSKYSVAVLSGDQENPQPIILSLWSELIALSLQIIISYHVAFLIVIDEFFMCLSCFLIQIVTSGT